MYLGCLRVLHLVSLHFTGKNIQVVKWSVLPINWFLFSCLRSLLFVMFVCLVYTFTQWFYEVFDHVSRVFKRKNQCENIEFKSDFFSTKKSKESDLYPFYFLDFFLLWMTLWVAFNVMNGNIAILNGVTIGGTLELDPMALIFTNTNIDLVAWGRHRSNISWAPCKCCTVCYITYIGVSQPRHDHMN